MPHKLTQMSNKINFLGGENIFLNFFIFRDVSVDVASRFNQFMQKSLLFLLDYADYDMISAWETMARIYSHSSVYIFYDHYGKDDSQSKEEFTLEYEEDPNTPQVTVRSVERRDKPSDLPWHACRCTASGPQPI